MDYNESEEARAERLLLESRLNESYLKELNALLRSKGMDTWHFDTSACIGGYATLYYDSGGAVHPKTLPTTSWAMFIDGAMAVIKAL